MEIDLTKADRLDLLKEYFEKVVEGKKKQITQMWEEEQAVARLHRQMLEAAAQLREVKDEIAVRACLNSQDRNLIRLGMLRRRGEQLTPFWKLGSDNIVELVQALKRRENRL